MMYQPYPRKSKTTISQNAASITGTAMTMGALVVEVPEPKSAAPDMSGMGGMGMGM